MSNAIRASLLIYDIPQRSNLANPSPFLRRMAVRANLSCWIIPTHLIPYSYLNELADGGATWHVVQFDTNESEKLLKMARESIAREMRAALNRARKAAQDAAVAYENPEEGETPTIANFEERVHRAVRRAEEVLRDLETAAGVFSIERSATPVAWAFEQATMIQTAAHERAKRYAEAAVTLRRIDPINGDGLANAAEADELPAGILADALDEAGASTEAAELRESFAGV